MHCNLMKGYQIRIVKAMSVIIRGNRENKMNNFFQRTGALILAVVFIGAGVLCLVLGITHLNKLSNGSYIETEATVTKIDETEDWDPDTDTYSNRYSITVQYSVDGKTYVGVLRENPKEFHEGMALTVVYDKDNPSDVTVPGTAGSWVIIALGAVGILAGGAVLVKKITGR